MSSSASVIIDNKFVRAPAKAKDETKDDPVGSLRGVFDIGRTKSLKFRRKQLKSILRLCEEHEDEMLEALRRDLHMSKFEGTLFEIEFIKNDVRNMLFNFEQWTKPVTTYRKLMNIFDTPQIYKDPLGVVLIVSHWNYPLHTALLPLAGAIAAGNCAVLRPSRKATNCFEFLAKNLHNYLDNDCYLIFSGDEIDFEQKILKSRFDYIFHSGGGNEAKELYTKGSADLTRTTFLVSTCKNPVYLDHDCDLELATKRILWGKCVNAGQTSISPDYILCTREVQDAFIKYVPKIIKEWYGPDPKHSGDFCRIINEEHYDKLVKTMKNNKIAYGGFTEPNTLFIHPTILTNISPNDEIMHQDIRGPIFPILTINNPEEAIAFINARDKPLALYIFSENQATITQFLHKTSSGSVCINDTLIQAAAESLPIGGYLGKYRGKETFDHFTHEKSVLKKRLSWLVERIEGFRYPPYTDFNLRIVNFAISRSRRFGYAFLWYLAVFFAGVVVGTIVLQF